MTPPTPQPRPTADGPPAQPQGTPSGPVRNAGQAAATAIGENPLKTWFAALPVDLAAVWVATGFAQTPVTVADEEPLLMGAFGLAWVVAGVFAWQSRQARLARQRRSWALVTVIVTAVSFGFAIAAGAFAQDPSNANFSAGDPDTGAGTRKVIATGEHLRDKQVLIVRADWDGKPGYEYEQGVARAGSTATRTFTAGPVLSARMLRAIAYVRGAEDDPPEDLVCGDYGPCAALTTALPGARPPNATVRLQARKLTIAIARRKRAPGQVYLTVFRGRGPRVVARHAVQIDNGAKTTRVNVPAGVRTVCVVATFDISAARKCTNRPTVTTVVRRVSR